MKRDIVLIGLIFLAAGCKLKADYIAQLRQFFTGLQLHASAANR